MNQRIQMLKEKWKGLGTPIKISIGTIGLALIIFLFFTFFMPDRYQVLYSGLDQKDQSNIEKYLSGKGIEYKVDAENNSLLVEGNVIGIKKDLALEGLPSGGTSGGLEQFNSMSLGATKYDKDVQYQNALQDELNNSLESMFEAVSNADVKLPIPEEKNIFKEENTNTQVSVALKLRSGYELTPQQVKAVQVYVAGALREVKPEDVQVVDQNLNPLSATTTEETSLAKQRSIVEETKRKLESELESTLSEVYGRVKVIANVDINFDDIVQNIKKYDPEGTIISKEESKERNREITGENVAIPGTDENGEVPRYEMEDIENENILSVQDKDSIIENFVVSETVEKIIKQPEFRTINVSVWFDDEDLTENDLFDAEEMVAVASGLKGEVNRVANNKAVYTNGSVKVTKKEFAQELEEPKQEEPVQEEGFFTKIPWYVYVIGGVLLLIIIAVIVILVIRSRRKKQRENDEEEELIGEQPINVVTEITNDNDIDNKTTAEDIDEELITSLGGKFNIEWSQEQKDLRNLTNEVAKKYPKETADVITKMMKK